MNMERVTVVEHGGNRDLDSLQFRGSGQHRGGFGSVLVDCKSVPEKLYSRRQRLLNVQAYERIIIPNQPSGITYEDSESCDQKRRDP